MRVFKGGNMLAINEDHQIEVTCNKIAVLCNKVVVVEDQIVNNFEP